MTRTLFSILLLLVAGNSAAQTQDAAIRLNQVGFYPDAPKVAIVVEAEVDSFFVENTTGNVVFRGALAAPVEWALSSEKVRVADFTALSEAGSYVLRVPGVRASSGFEIGPDIHDDVARAAAKGFYFQRASMSLLEEFAGKWSRAAGHPDTIVYVHPSAAGPERATGAIIRAPKGWYDAGDYNKYVVNSGISTSTLLSLYEDFPAYVAALDVDIPESGDAIPDLLDEALWNLRWMLAMQDPADGGVYHKLTTADFEGMVRPQDAAARRYVVQKSTTAALNFAAVMAQAARILVDFPAGYPGLPDSMQTAAVRAWEWARRHPEVLYNQRALNTEYDPDIETGAYGDRSADDEFAWAAAELFVTTGADSFLTAVPLVDDFDVPTWSNVRALGYYTLLRHRDHLQSRSSAGETLHEIEAALLRWTDEAVAAAAEHPYRTVMGQTARDFNWGSSSNAANQGIALVQAYRLTGDAEYLEAALSNLDYLLGRNATGYSFVTGIGDHPPMYPHHRPSESDGIDDPVPGLLVGGPNAGRQDGCDYPATEPARSYVDAECSYASNEIAINWNAPLVYLAAALEALQATFRE